MRNSIRKLVSFIYRKLPSKYRYVYVDVKWFIENAKRFLRNNLKFKFLSENDLNVIYFIIDPKKTHCGMVDRFKGIVNAYYFAKLNDYKFKIIYKTPFPLENYLQPNKVDWVADFSDLKYSLFQTRFINECEWHKPPKLKRNRQYHIYNYVGNGMYTFIPQKDIVQVWHSLFIELFKPSERLADAITSNISCIVGNDKDAEYYAIHIRFVNVLDNFEPSLANGTCGILDESEKANFIKRCKDGILKIIQDNGERNRYLVLSDSKVFLTSIGDIPVVTLDSTKLGHVSFTDSEDSTMKTFVDFYLLANAKAVFRIMAPELYSSSCFASHAAIVGNAPFVTIYV